MPKKPAPINRAQPKQVKKRDVVVRPSIRIKIPHRIWVKGILHLSVRKCKPQFSPVCCRKKVPCITRPVELPCPGVGNTRPVRLCGGKLAGDGGIHGLSVASLGGVPYGTSVPLQLIYKPSSSKGDGTAENPPLPIDSANGQLLLQHKLPACLSSGRPPWRYSLRDNRLRNRNGVRMAPDAVSVKPPGLILRR